MTAISSSDSAAIGNGSNRSSRFVPCMDHALEVDMQTFQVFPL
jgi:hypothetical protein